MCPASRDGSVTPDVNERGTTSGRHRPPEVIPPIHHSSWRDATPNPPGADPAVSDVPASSPLTPGPRRDDARAPGGSRRPAYAGRIRSLTRPANRPGGLTLGEQPAASSVSQRPASAPSPQLPPFPQSPVPNPQSLARREELRTLRGSRRE